MKRTRWPSWMRTGLLPWILVGVVGTLSVAAERTPWLAGRIQGSPEPPAPCRLERAFPRLGFVAPVDLAWEASSGRYWVLGLGGTLWSFPATPDPDVAKVAGTLAKTREGQPRPFKQALGFAFHPGFATNHFVYVAYQTEEATPDGSRVSRFHMALGASPRLEVETELPILHWRGGGHDGCSLKFGPDGRLYISTGDSESPEPPDRLRTGQDLGDLLSSILRVDVDHPDAGKSYGIPRDNPFVGRPGARPEVWAYGFRNPWRTSFGPDGALWVGDVGWETWETIHRVTAGYNAGWSRMEGPQLVYPEIEPPTPISAPMVSHPHSEAASITGGCFYEGRRLPELRGAYIYGDWETGKIWALRHDGARMTEDREICDTTLKIVCFASGSDGEMLVLDHREGGVASGIHRLVRNDAVASAAAFPRKLSETGLFTDVARQVPAPGVVSYRPVATQWADHATSERWVAVPGTSQITTDRGHPWSEVSWAFPSNAVLAKTLSLERVMGDPASRRRVETQVLHQDGESWQAYTYRWNEAQTDADLVPSQGDAVEVAVTDPSAPGGVRRQTWRFHSRAECLRCHNFWPGTALAFGWDSLAGKPSEGAASSEMARLVGLGVLRETRKPEKAVAALRDPADPAGPLDLRARTWLHVNCAHCHRFGSGGAVAAYFNADARLEDLRILDLKPTRGGFGIPDARILAPHEPWRSVLLHRAGSTGGGHMPALGSRLRDEAGLALLRDWVAAMPPAAGPARAEDPEAVGGRLVAVAAGARRRDALKAAWTNTSVALAVLDRVPRDASLRADAVAVAVDHPNTAVRDLFRHLMRPEQLRPVLGEAFESAQVLEIAGDVVRGRAVFRSDSGPNCSRCHVSEGWGRSYGPDLTRIGQKYDAGTLLMHIRQPSLTIAPEFALHVLELKDDASYSGFLVRSDDREVVLRTEAGEQAWPRSAVLRLEKSPQSAMPEGLLAPLTAAEAADLLAYLRRPSP